jgi:hypothetical protein
MKLRFCLFIFATLGCAAVFGQPGFSEDQFFQSLSTDDLKLLDKTLASLESTSFGEKNAYKGVLLMRKAGLVSSLRSKYFLFKEGHSLLESAIEKDPSNVTYRFLRVIIQENAPMFLNYNDDLEADNRWIRVKFDTLSPVVKNAILDYSKKSKYLRVG